ncbi:methyltransferase domain-containing protein [Simplicispira psychrophila]|uniref:methyltransferase domain-containing protein n=1 Tax=Simplicispira psychrophila TaxID=80882 RepID=UPI0004801AFE|nr:methyltransferase domain-containing protein [Simplicispira psychrophila]
MTYSIEDLHVYLRSITQDERTSLSVLAHLIPARARVLDLGCGSGALGQHLVQNKGCSVDGVTLNEAEAAHAHPYYSRIVVDNLETCDLLATFAGQRYDAIVCADVLEHLSRPERILAACRELLKPDGQLLISVPNAGYCGLIAELLQGEFCYREEGLLDRTHLRFFTRRSLTRFLGEQRWAIDSLDTICRELPESEFKVAFDSLPPAAARHLLGIPDALTYQFITVARPVSDIPVLALTPATAPSAPAQARFTVQLYLGYEGTYAEDSKLTTTGVIGQERQTLCFTLPPHSTPLTRLRLDPADRAGFLHLYRLTLRTPDSAPTWQWSSDIYPRASLAQTPHNQIVWQTPLASASSATLLLLTGDDPWFELPIAPDTLMRSVPHGAILEIELGWPMSADYLALSNTVRPLQERIEQIESSAQTQLQQAQEQLQQTQGQLRQQLQQAQTLLSAVQHRNIALEEKAATLTVQRAELQRSAIHLQLNFDQLAQYLRTIEASTVFRAARPLVHTKMAIDRLLGRGTRHNTATSAVPTPISMAPTPHPVDIIVPIYRGLADTQLCINSVLSSPCTKSYRLIAINDASPEPEVTEWLRARAAQDSRITLLENTNNLGFVGTVNRGMALSNSNDVLLLNSDTEVANDWLDRIHRAAYSNSRIASVTPLSNNATICSYPQFCKDNELPAGYDTAQLDALCARTNPGAAVDVPTGVGFCMYIRRDCLAQVGLFDTDNFGKGYGEENDFCQRALQAGWRNLHLLDTFVLHTGGVSFGDSKSPREKAAMETLRRLHPLYERDVMAFVQQDPARPYRLALDLARIAEAHLPVVLAVLHDRGGGTLRHVQELAQHLAAHATVLTLTPAPGHSVSLRMAGTHEGFEVVFRLADQYEDLLQALRHIGVRHLHYHHLLGHGPLILELPQQLGLAYDFTAHDFYSYCTHISLTGNNNRYADEPAPGQCGCCQPYDAAPTGSGTVADWRQHNQRFLTGARQVLTPSHDTAQRIAAFAPGARVRMATHTDIAAYLAEHPALHGALPTPAPQPHGGALKVVVLGALSAIKGADLLEAVAQEAARRGAPVEFHLLGYGYRHLQTQPRAQLTVHGAYEEIDLPRLLQWLQPDLVWFPAQWPETYSYTLSACLQAGLPVLAPDLGAFTERLAGRPWSWVQPWDLSAKEWLDTLLHLRDSHFTTGQAPIPIPTPIYITSAADAENPSWSYRTDYLHQLPPACAEAATPLALAFLTTHQPVAPYATGAKSLMLTTVLRLRSLPLLRGVAQRIPQHWQTQVKNWLSA